MSCPCSRRKATISFVLSVHLFAWNNLAPIGQIFMKFDVLSILENLSRIFTYLTTITNALHEDHYILMILSRSVIFKMRTVSDKSCGENLKKYIFYLFYFIFSKIVPCMR